MPWKKRDVGEGRAWILKAVRETLIGGGCFSQVLMGSPEESYMLGLERQKWTVSHSKAAIKKLFRTKENPVHPHSSDFPQLAAPPTPLMVCGAHSVMLLGTPLGQLEMHVFLHCRCHTPGNG